MVAGVMAAAVWWAVGQAEPKGEPKPPSEQPISTLPGKVGDALRKWAKEGTAAGNVGDWYDNRDGAHSDLNTGPYPQLQRVVYTPEDVKAMRHWAAARLVRPEVTFGNSSTSAPPTLGGSNPRSYYCSPLGLQLLHRQYVGNNLYIYPEHRDHDPGHNGRVDGFGDLYPTNTPYLLISQGSSGSDQPFMRVAPLYLAALRPEVKKRLVQSGTLWPTFQMLLRKTSKGLKTPDEYFTGKAHPTVFEGSHVDDGALVNATHDLTLETLPPLVRIKVEEETETVPGRDYFDVAGRTEKLCDTPGCVARIVRGAMRERRLVVDASESVCDNGLSLTFRWVVLRGEAKVTPRGASAEIVVAAPTRRPIAPGSAMESNRVDVAVFASNGKTWSAPAFVTFFGLDSEAREYRPDGRVAEIGYGHGETVFLVTHWPEWLRRATEPGLASEWLVWSPEDREFLRECESRMRELAEVETRLREKRQSAAARVAELAKEKAPEEKRKQADSDVQAAQKELQAATKAIEDFASGKGAKRSLRELVERKLHAVSEQAGLLAMARKSALWEQATPGDRKAVEEAAALFVGLGYAEDDASATPYARGQRQRLQGVVLARIVFPGTLTATHRANFVDVRLTAPRTWRDVYRYGPAGLMLGWTRFDGKTRTEFGVQGLIVEKTDDLGRCIVGTSVEYAQEALTKPGLNDRPLRWTASAAGVVVSYRNARDERGKIER